MNVLLTSVGRRTYLVEYFKEALRGRGKVIAANTTQDASGMQIADVACVVPPPTSPGFVDEILKICATHDVKLVLSLHDWETPYLAAGAERFRSKGVLLGVSRQDVIDLCLDKLKTYEFARKHSFATPTTVVSLAAANNAISSGELRFPVIVKPRRGQGSVGLEVAENDLELDFYVNRNLRIAAQMSSNGLLSHDGPEAVLVQERLVGVEYGLDVFNDFEGRFVCCLVKRKFEMRAGETDAAETVRDPVLEAFGRRLGELIGHIGMLDVDVIKVGDTPYLLELNPRFGGHYPFSHAAGANIPAAMIALALGDQPKNEWLRVRPGVKCFKGITLFKNDADEPAPPQEETATQSKVARWRVLVFPGGTEIGLELWQSLSWCKEVALFSAGDADHTHAPYIFARHFPVHNIYHPDCLADLEKVIAEQGITHIFPAHDDVLMMLVENASRFSAKIVTSSLETCRIARSKTATRQALKEIIPTPIQFSNPAEISNFPVFLKPDRGQGSNGTAIARNSAELTALLVQDSNRIILEYLPGKEFTVDCFSDRDRGVLYASGRERRRIRYGIAMDSKFVDNPLFAEYAERINSVLKFHGAWFYQVKEDVDGRLKLMEVSCRIGGTSGLSRVRGVNLPLLSLYEADRISVKVEPMDFDVEIDRALVNRYRHNISYQTLYVDFDDTLVVHGKLNVLLVSVLYQAMSRGVRLVLLTRHAKDIKQTLRSHRLHELFDEIIRLQANEPKADYIKEREAVFIDDSFAERADVRAKTGIPVFDTTMLRVLLDERA